MTFLMLGKVVMAFLGLITVALLTRHLGASGYGYYRTVLSYLSFVAILTHFDLDLIVLRDISQAGAEQARIVGNALSMRLIITAVILLFAAFGALLLPYDVVVQHGILFGTLSYIAVMGYRLLFVVFQQKIQQWQAMVAEIVGAAIVLGLVWLLTHVGAGVFAAIGALVAGDVMAFVLLWLLARRLVPFRLRFEWEEWKRLAVMVLPLAGAEMLALIHRRADAVLLSLFQPAAEVGFYGISYKLYETSSQLPVIFSGLMMPFLSQHALHNRVQFERYLSAAIDILLIGLVGVVGIMLTFAREIVTLVGGAAFAPAADAVRVLSLALVTFSLSTICRYAVTALDKQQLMLWGQGVAALVGLTTYLLLIPSYSYVGAAWGTVLAEGTVWLFAGTIVVRATGKVPSLLTFAKALAAGAVMFGIFQLLKGADISWGLNLCLGSLCYLGLLLILRTVPKNVLAALLSTRSV
jgi:O-antigen/teichoic acid export membrane protein